MNRKIFCWLLLSFMTFSAIAKDAPDCHLAQYASVDLVTGGDVLVPVTLQGKKGLMVLNPSSSTSSIFRNVVDELSLRIKRAPPSVKFMQGTERLKEVAAFDSLSIGRADLGYGEFLIEPTPEAISGIGEIAVLGRLGNGVFANIDFEVDLAHRKLNLFSQNHCTGDVVYWSDTFASAPLLRGQLSELYFVVELDGKRIQAQFAPHLPMSTLRTDISERVFGFDADSTKVETEFDLTTGKPVAHFRAMELTAPGLTARNARINLLPPVPKWPCRPEASVRAGSVARYTGCWGVYPLQLGRNVLEKLRLYFATKEQVVYFTDADAT